MPTAPAYQQAIDPDAPHTYGVDEVHVTCPKAADAGRATLLDVMYELNQELGVTFVFATHDTRVMERSRRLVRMVDGAIDSDETHP